ncbi:unnamed protein product [Rotaria sp. Silwood2]|nr:unnamed protein product [Rotaria sp. Silwood2]
MIFNIPQVNYFSSTFLIECSFSSFTNGDFELGNSFGWTIGGGYRGSINSSQLQIGDILPGGSKYDSNIANSHSSIVTSGNDPSLGALMPNIVFQGSYSWRIEDVTVNSYMSALSQRINQYYCTDIYFAWLAVLENGGHTAEQSSLLVIELKDATIGDTLLLRQYNAQAGNGGVDSRFNVSDSLFYTPSWQIEHLNISSTRIGHDFVLNIMAADCNQGGHRGYAYIDSFGGVAP